jgi:hypothetical protein
VVGRQPCTHDINRYCCITCDKRIGDHATIFETEADRKAAGLPVGVHFRPLAQHPAVLDAVKLHRPLQPGGRAHASAATSGRRASDHGKGFNTEKSPRSRGHFGLATPTFAAVGSLLEPTLEQRFERGQLSAGEYRQAVMKADALAVVASKRLQPTTRTRPIRATSMARNSMTLGGAGVPPLQRGLLLSTGSTKGQQKVRKGSAGQRPVGAGSSSGGGGGSGGGDSAGGSSGVSLRPTGARALRELPHLSVTAQEGGATVGIYHVADTAGDFVTTNIGQFPPARPRFSDGSSPWVRQQPKRAPPTSKSGTAKGGGGRG